MDSRKRRLESGGQPAGSSNEPHIPPGSFNAQKSKRTLGREGGRPFRRLASTEVGDPVGDGERSPTERAAKGARFNFSAPHAIREEHQELFFVLLRAAEVVGELDEHGDERYDCGSGAERPDGPIRIQSMSTRGGRDAT